MLWYRVARPNELLVITGYRIKDIKLTKKALILPGQRFSRIDLSPVKYTFQVQAMSAEKLPFILTAVFTIGPRVECPESLLKFAKLIASRVNKSSTHVNELVQGVIQGGTRVLAASMTMEQIFKGTKEFKSEVFEKVQLELNQFGLLIYNANVKQLVDYRGHEYFSYLGQKTQMEAAYQAKVEVAEARMKGEIGEKERTGLTLQNAAKIDTETYVISMQRHGEGKKEAIKVQTDVKIFENIKEAEVAKANADLAVKKAEWARSAQIAEVEAEQAVAIRDAQLQGEVEKQNASTQYDIKVQEANWELYKKEKEAEAALHKSMKEADADLYSKKKEAKGIEVLSQAQGVYVSTILKALNGNHRALMEYMMIEKGLSQDMAKANASAIKGLQPEMSISTGANGGGSPGGGGGELKDVADVYTMLKTVLEQTGTLPPSLLGKLADVPPSSPK